MSYKNKSEILEVADVGEDSEQEGYYYVESILDKRITKGKVWYKVKWKDWPIESSTWQCVDELDSCPDIIEAYEAKLLAIKQGSSNKSVADNSYTNPNKDYSNSKERNKESINSSVEKKNTANNSMNIEPSKKNVVNLNTNTTHTLNTNSNKENENDDDRQEERLQYPEDIQDEELLYCNTNGNGNSNANFNGNSTNTNNTNLNTNSNHYTNTNPVIAHQPIPQPKPQSQTQDKVLTESFKNKSYEEDNNKPTEGNLNEDEPASILAAKKSGNDILLLVKWKPRKSGVVPENAKILSSAFRKSHPRMLIDYYESKVC